MPKTKRKAKKGKTPTVAQLTRKNRQLDRAVEYWHGAAEAFLSELHNLQKQNQATSTGLDRLEKHIDRRLEHYRV